HPDDDCIGFELRYKRLVKAARKLERDHLTNVWLLRAEAEHFGGFFGDTSLDLVFVNFPDPWPKRSSLKKRLINQRLLRELERLLRPGGALCLKTDHAGYFLHSLGVVTAEPGWRITDWTNDLHQRTRPLLGCPEASAVTEFEALFRSQQKPV